MRENLIANIMAENKVLKDKNNKILNFKIPRYEKMVAIELFNNPSGTGGEITLDDSLNNYEYIEIYYNNPTFDIYDSSRIDNPEGKKTSLKVSMRYSDGGAYYTYFRDVSLNGNKITNLFGGYYAIKVDGSIEYFNNVNYISITKVLGYKKA